VAVNKEMNVVASILTLFAVTLVIGLIWLIPLKMYFESILSIILIFILIIWIYLVPPKGFKKKIQLE
jgi:energy-coupling factor transporter transmembrane protein EcfT